MDDILKEVLELPSAQRRDLMRKIGKSLIKEEHAENLRERYELVKSVVEDVMTHKITDERTRDNVLCRMFIAYILHQDGYSLSKIGEMLGKDHSTITYLVRTVKDMIQVPLAYSFEISKLNSIETKLQWEKISDDSL